MKAEIGVMQLQAKECWGLLATTSSQKNLWRKHGPPAPWFQTSCLQNCVRIDFYCFKRPDWLHFVTITLGTRFYTWKSPEGQYRNQIDYIICSQRWRSSIQSAKTRLGTDCGSDHELLTAKFRLKLKKVRKTTGIFAAAAAAKSLQSCSTLCNPIDGSPPGSPCCWDSPGKNTGVGCHFLLQCMKVKSESEVTQSCLTPSNPMDYSLAGSPIHGIFQARVLEWGAIIA